MAFEAFDTAAIDAYAAEAKERWGGGEAYRQSAKRTAAYTAEDWNAVQEEMRAQFARFAALRGGDPAGEEAQAAVRSAQAVHQLPVLRLHQGDPRRAWARCISRTNGFERALTAAAREPPGSPGGHRDLLRDMKKAGRPFGAGPAWFLVLHFAVVGGVGQGGFFLFLGENRGDGGGIGGHGAIHDGFELLAVQFFVLEQVAGPRRGAYPYARTASFPFRHSRR